MSRQSFRAAMARPAPQLVVAPLAIDALSAALAKRLGFSAVYLGGGALGYARGVSEALLTATEVADVVRVLTERVDIDVIVDGTNGFGDAVHVARSVRLIEQAGAVAIEIEDQPAPKRALHQKHEGASDLIVPIGEMVDKVATAVDARRNDDFLVIARTNALYNSSVGIDEAIERALAYSAAGADMLLLYPRTMDEIRALSEATSLPLVSMTPSNLSREELVAAGYALYCDAVSATLATFNALKQAYTVLSETAVFTGDVAEMLAPLAEVGETINMQELYEIEERTTERRRVRPGTAATVPDQDGPP